MDRRIHNNQEDLPNPTSETCPDSPLSADDSKIKSSPSSKKRFNKDSFGRNGQKRVVSVPIGDMEGSKTKGEAYPPSDSWTWRKYGQKPIKGSPYPRGYYRCSSSKGCPARKQVERSRVDPTLLIVTYASDHSHSSPSKPSAAAAPAPASPAATEVDLPPELGDDSVLASEFCWFPDSTASASLLEIPIYNSSGDFDVASMKFSMKEEDESLFADLGELPESSLIFRRRFVELDERNPMNVVPCCGDRNL